MPVAALFTRVCLPSLIVSYYEVDKMEFAGFTVRSSSSSERLFGFVVLNYIVDQEKQVFACFVVELFNIFEGGSI